MRKITLVLLVCFSLLTAALPVSATGSLLQLRLEAREKALEIRSNRLENKTIWVANATLRTQIKLRLVSIKEAGTVIDETVLLQIKALTATLKTKYAALKDTKGSIQTLVEGIPGLIESKDWATLKTTYLSILAIQTNRNALLTEINGLLTQIKDLLP